MKVTIFNGMYQAEGTVEQCAELLARFTFLIETVKKHIEKAELDEMVTKTWQEILERGNGQN